jgi:hypothetical protein
MMSSFVHLAVSQRTPGRRTSSGGLVKVGTSLRFLSLTESRVFVVLRDLNVSFQDFTFEDEEKFSCLGSRVFFSGCKIQRENLWLVVGWLGANTPTKRFSLHILQPEKRTLLGSGSNRLSRWLVFPLSGKRLGGRERGCLSREGHCERRKICENCSIRLLLINKRVTKNVIEVEFF